MIRWICGAKLADEIPSAVLHQKLDLDEITAFFTLGVLGGTGTYSVPLRASTPHHAIGASRHQRVWEAKEDVVCMCEK